VLSDGKYIGKNILEMLFNLNSGKDFTLAHKFTNKHLLVEGSGRMNVKLAAQLFSNSVSKAISFCGEIKLIEEYNWKEISILKIHRLFSVLLFFFSRSLHGLLVIFYMIILESFVALSMPVI